MYEERACTKDIGIDMGKVHFEIGDSLKKFIEDQRIFFVATAPSGSDGHINLSPKGLDCLRIIDSKTVAYLDFAGSGVETIAHLRENGRIVIMVCAFDGSPNIVRLQGRGRAIEPQDEGFSAMLVHFHPYPNPRAIICVDLERITDSCGYGVPTFKYEGERTQLVAWVDKKGKDGLMEYQRKNNSKSVDGLPGLRWTDD